MKERIVDSALASGYEQWRSGRCRSAMGKGEGIYEEYLRNYLSNFSTRGWSGLGAT